MLKNVASLTLSAFFVLLELSPLSAAEITSKNIRFVNCPNFPDAHSSWGSIGYSRKYNKVFIGVTNHRDKVGLFEYDPAKDKMRLCGFLPQLANLRDWQWQGKVHSQIVEGPDGCMYFTTDGGETRMLYLMDHPRSYAGGYFFKWDPSTDRLTNLGMALRYESVKDITIDRLSGLVLGVSFPQVHLILYDPAKNDLRDLGRVGSAHVPRVLFSDWFGNMYYVEWRQLSIHDHLKPHQGA